MSGLMRSVMNENQNSQSQVHVTALRCLRFKPGKQGLNTQSALTCTAGGAGSHTLPNHVTGNGRSTRHSRWIITLRPGALLNFFYSFPTVAVCLIITIHYFCDWGRRYSQVRFPAIQEVCPLLGCQADFKVTHGPGLEREQHQLCQACNQIFLQIA